MFDHTTTSPEPLESALDVYDTTARIPTLFRHSKRNRWGIGLVLRKLDDRVQMQFQDGRQRTFKHGYYHLFDTVDRPLDVALGIVKALESMSGSTGSERGTRSGSRPISMDEQIAYLRELFPDGFQDEDYRTHHRGDGRKRPLKRHRDALIAAAAEHLSKAAMRRAMSAGEPAKVHAAACRVISSTDLVALAERKALSAMDPAHHAAFADALFALLHGTSKLAPRFDAFVATLERALGQTPSWALSTVFLGAVHPVDHAVVRERVFSLQAEWTAPGLSVASRPMGILYERLQTMVATVRTELEEAGLTPRDLFDVADFMWTTRRPKARERILEMRRLGLDASPPAASEASRPAA